MDKQKIDTNKYLAQKKLEAQKKTKDAAWILWFFTGGVGGHDFYFGENGKGIIKIAINIFSWILWFPWLILLVWNIIDACNINLKLSTINDEIDMKLARLLNDEMTEAEILAIVYK